MYYNKIGDYMKAIVLSGGGSKGSYQIGVWKALRKLHIKYDIVTGTSVGALNGAMMVQNKYHKAVDLWNHISMSRLFGENVNTSNDIDLYKVYAKKFIEENGIDPSGLKVIINESANINKIYKSKTKFGLVTFNLTDMKPEILTREDIPKDKFNDYLLASCSCYPAFKPNEIDNKKYVDGGYYDNLPINLAIDLGATEAIVIDLTAPGVKRLPKEKIPTIKIKPNNELSNFLDFDQKEVKRNIKYGYNDTMKVFKKYIGKKYTFTNNTINKLKTNYKDTFLYLFNEIINTKSSLEAIKETLKLENLDDDMDRVLDKLILRSMENLGKNYYIDDTRIYTLKSFNKELLSHFKKSDKNIKEQEIYNLLKKHEYKKIKPLALKNPIHFISVLYVYTIMEN